MYNSPVGRYKAYYVFMAKLFKQYPFSPYKGKDFFLAKYRNESKNAAC